MEVVMRKKSQKYLPSSHQRLALLQMAHQKVPFLNLSGRTSFPNDLLETSKNDAAIHTSTEPAIDPLVGPVLGPAAPAPIDVTTPELQEDGDFAPQSPYSTERALIRDLTLPTAPNYDIPPSPPGSPDASTDAKFKHFLNLKQQGIHFNAKLAKSSALKNPSLMQKLMDFSDIGEDDQYSTTLSKDLWNPNGFPEDAYKEALSKSQQQIRKRLEEKKARGQRESVDFVPATASGESSRSGTPGFSGRAGPKSAAERVLAELDGGRSSSPQGQNLKRKTRFDR
jgi:hypothetical protein